MASAYRDSAKAVESEVRIASFGAPHEAALARAYLESEGIPCRIADDFLVGTALGYEAAFGGVKLFVSSSDALRASELLESYRTAPASRRRAETQPERLRRAFRTSIVGFVLFPVALHVLSLWLLRNVAYRDLNDADKKTYAVTQVLNWAVLAVLGEWWRDRTDLREALCLSAHVEPLSAEIARLAGDALAAIPSAGTIDAFVMSSASRRGDVILTSDCEDLEKLQKFFPGVRLLSV